MTGKIQTQAAGLLSLLGIKGTGDNPQELGAAVVPTVDMLAYYLPRNLETVSQSIGPAPLAANTGVGITVPAGEYWFVRDLSGALLASAAAQQLGLALIYQPVAGSPGIALGFQANLASIAAGDIQRVAKRQERIFGPGTVFSCLSSNANAANVTISVNVSFVRLTA